MAFSSPFFLFAFLPLVLAAFYLAPHRLRNLVLLLASLFFYAWGESRFAWVLPASILGNFAAALLLVRLSSRRSSSLCFVAVITANLGLLVAFKYTEFIAENLNPGMAFLGLPQFRLIAPHLPLGISFFTFQAIAYFADVASNEVPAERNLGRFALAAALFPHLVAGPIVRYRDLLGQLDRRQVALEDFAAGIRRLIFGLAKKVLLANPLGWAADQAFNRAPTELAMDAAWLGVFCYALQIYFDFSGYSDMAIGLGRMFGFTFPENFRFPYAATSIADFWRRWHITLSSWLRDYVYIPLGGGRRGRWRVVLNLFVVFAICGIWHGAAWTFLVWGMWHGVFLVAERLGALDRFPLLARRAWTMLAVLGGWVFFRSDSLHHAAGYFQAMVGIGHGIRASDLLTGDIVIVLLFAVPSCFPVVRWLREHWTNRQPSPWREWFGASAELATCGALAVLSVVCLTGGSHNAFLYYRF